ncbi:MAG: hypothetical protein Q4D65_05775 [Peptostreptococcaceae bacterium]|nr:hypothetical protein [Peptostreptococcaceae bacterium]
MIILAWLYYSWYYILLSVLVTLMLNRLFKKLWLPPLLINAIAVLLLLYMTKSGMLHQEAASYAMYFNYVPVVLSSIITNIVIYFRQKNSRRKD